MTPRGVMESVRRKNVTKSFAGEENNTPFAENFLSDLSITSA